MSLSAYFIVADEHTVSLQIIIDKVALSYYKTAVAFEKGFNDTYQLKSDVLMMWMADADGTAVFC